ncbi:unnamed protein product [Allacma fusca]|uniref:GP-PDE domain-containing protein n=1 Tax=Allacma fusca TaxID=39272 RepID=A0A8J2JPX7_9HEXA|nr:unnamed protein product [Allacma fusca]
MYTAVGFVVLKPGFTVGYRELSLFFSAIFKTNSPDLHLNLFKSELKILLSGHANNTQRDDLCDSGNWIKFNNWKINMTSNYQNFKALRDMLPCFYVCASVYACYLGFNGIMVTGVLFSVLAFCSLSLTLNYFKIESAPLEHCEGVFGDPKEYVGFLSYNESAANLEPPDGTEEYDSTARSHPNAVIIGHRGAGLDAPENSLSAFRLCKSRGCDFVELDVALTKDKVLVVFHDDDLLRMAGLRNKISEMTIEELQVVDISVYHPLKEKFPEEKIPTFNEVVQLLLDLKMRFFIDLKDTDSEVSISEAGPLKSK